MIGLRRTIILLASVMCLLASISVRSQTGPVADASHQQDLRRAYQNQVQSQQLRETIQENCRNYLRSHSKAPESVEFQLPVDDLVKWQHNVRCHSNQCSTADFFVVTKAYALNTFGARLLHSFSCDVLCDSNVARKEVPENAADCRVERIWEDR